MAIHHVNRFQNFARLMSLNRSVNVYHYVYDHPHDKAMHGFDLPAVFGNAFPASMGTPPPSTLINRTQSIWARFAAVGTPGVRQWPSVQPDSQVKAWVLGPTVEYAEEVEHAACPGWTRAADKA